MLELFPGGFEEVDGHDGVELIAYTDAGGEERLWHAFGGARAQDGAADWRHRGKSFHHPVRRGPMRSGPPWSEVPPHPAPRENAPRRACEPGAHPAPRP